MSKESFDGLSLIAPRAVVPWGSRDGALGAGLENASLELSLVLSGAESQFIGGVEPAVVIDQVATRLHKLRRRFHPTIWHSLIAQAQAHRVAAYFLEDPFTRHSFRKPRGYSGDAQLLDFIYRHASVRDDVTSASPLGQALHAYTINASSSVAVRERRDILTREVDCVAARKPGAEILTIAAGHLREANASRALAGGSVKRWIALDQDPLSVGSIARDFAGTAIDAIDGSVRGLLTNAYALGSFDLIYAAGLYDYLTRAVAVKLTSRCVEMLKPGGTFLFANFADEIAVDGYMETFMNWPLLLRTEDDIWKIANASVDRNRVDVEVFHGNNRNIVYARLTRRD